MLTVQAEFENQLIAGLVDLPWVGHQLVEQVDGEELQHGPLPQAGGRLVGGEGEAAQLGGRQQAVPGNTGINMSGGMCD